MKTGIEEIEAIETTSEIPAAYPGVAPKISHAVFLTGSQVARRLLRLVFVLLAARVIGPKQFGTYALLLAMVELVAVASGSGLVDYLTRETAKDERLGWGLGSQLAWLRLAYLLPISAAALGILRLLGYPQLVLAGASGMCLTLVPRAVSETVQGLLRGIGRYGLYLAIELSLGLMLLAAGFLLLVRGGGLRHVIAAELAASGLAALAALFIAVRHRTADRTRLPWIEAVRKSLPFNIYPLVGSLYNRLDVVMLSKLAGNYATGIYTVAYRSMEMFQLIPYGVLYSLLPSLSSPACRQAERRQRLERAMGLLACAALVTVLGAQVFAGPAVRVMLGVRYLEAVPAARILIWALIPMYMNFGLNIGLLATGREKVFVVTASTCLGVNFLANLIFIPIFSWRAAAAATIATELVLLAQNVYWIRGALGVVPLPYGVLRRSIAFLGIFAVSMAGERTAFPLLAGTSCFLAFLGYLYRSGIMAEITLVWPTSPNVSA